MLQVLSIVLVDTFLHSSLNHVSKKGFYGGGVLGYRNTGYVFKGTTESNTPNLPQLSPEATFTDVAHTAAQ